MFFASDEEVLHNDFQRILKNRNSKFHEALELIVVDESHTVETWMGKRFVMIFDVCLLEDFLPKVDFDISIVLTSLAK